MAGLLANACSEEPDALIALVRVCGGAPRVTGGSTRKREYPDAADQIREVLIHGNDLSQKDIDICLVFDAESLASSPGIEGIRELHGSLTETYKGEDATSAA